ncbi:MAG: response regulator transcription factor [Clostridia bacterium]|nr:response regulator transcription factor [Clostridia bacterium]
MQKILIADDEARIRDILKEYLDFEGFSYDEAEDGLQAVNMIKENSYDLVILDIMMPKVDGFTALREIRKFSKVPVIMLSARAEEYDKLFGFEMGVDDYITKPFSPKEVMARIKAVLKRTSHNEETSNSVIVIGGLEIDETSRKVLVDGAVASLTPKEFDILLFMAKNKGVVFSREKILEKIWGYEFFGEDRTVDTHIKMLRNSLGKYRSLIKTVWSVGYKLEEDYEENQK